MNFHEYQAKELFAAYGIPVPAGSWRQRRWQRLKVPVRAVTRGLSKGRFMPVDEAKPAGAQSGQKVWKKSGLNLNACYMKMARAVGLNYL